jgi:hypothetical protein
MIVLFFLGGIMPFPKWNNKKMKIKEEKKCIHAIIFVTNIFKSFLYETTKKNQEKKSRN